MKHVGREKDRWGTLTLFHPFNLGGQEESKDYCLKILTTLPCINHWNLGWVIYCKTLELFLLAQNNPAKNATFFFE
jgi:hypothetical protein